ncbi:MAG: hypothetical protein CSA65_03085 [Proteobacteria bacterium]|nr:MAG: hypothetical protein CSA65_03085 [Pseudomonadota bacterium]
MNLGDYELTILLLFLGAVLIPQIISIIVYHRVLGPLPIERRLISRRATFLLLIPFFSTAFEFYVVLRLSRSLREYFDIVEEPEMGGCGRVLGVSFCLFNAAGLIPAIGIAFAVVGFILWVMYMMTMLEVRAVVVTTLGRYPEALARCKAMTEAEAKGETKQETA